MLNFIVWPFALVGFGFTAWHVLRWTKAGRDRYQAWREWRTDWGREITVIHLEEVWMSQALRDFAAPYAWVGVGHKALREELAKVGLSEERMSLTYKVFRNLGKPEMGEGDYGIQEDCEIDFFIKGMEAASIYSRYAFPIDRSKAVVKIKEEKPLRAAS